VIRKWLKAKRGLDAYTFAQAVETAWTAYKEKKEMSVMTEEATQKKGAPVISEKLGNVSGAVWLNVRPYKGKKVKSLSFTFQKNYTNKDGKWGHTPSFGLHELPKLALVVDALYEKAIKQRRELVGESESGGEKDGHDSDNSGY